MKSPALLDNSESKLTIVLNLVAQSGCHFENDNEGAMKISSPRVLWAAAAVATEVKRTLCLPRTMIPSPNCPVSFRGSPTPRLSSCWVRLWTLGQNRESKNGFIYYYYFCMIYHPTHKVQSHFVSENVNRNSMKQKFSLDFKKLILSTILHWKKLYLNTGLLWPLYVKGSIMSNCLCPLYKHFGTRRVWPLWSLKG